MDAIISFVGSVALYAFAPIRKEVDYLILYKRNFTKLNGCVQNWLVEVNEVIERANLLLLLFEK
jgi:hypothetical protein